jgi:hypothetical protein
VVTDHSPFRARWRWMAALPACLVFASCASTEERPEGEPSPSQQRPAAADTSPTPDEQLPLYGTYFRPDPGLKPKKKDEWGIHFVGGDFETPAGWRGVVSVFYFDGRNSRGHAYKYSSDLRTLVLGPETEPRDKLPLGGFECEPAQGATYAWSRRANNYRLYLQAVEEPCTARRSILEGDWQFYD